MDDWPVATAGWSGRNGTGVRLSGRATAEFVVKSGVFRTARGESAGRVEQQWRFGAAPDSGGAAVAMMKAADHRLPDDFALVGRFDFARNGRSAINGLVRPRFGEKVQDRGNCLVDAK
jgi:hypothetical protein